MKLPDLPLTLDSTDVKAMSEAMTVLNEHFDGRIRVRRIVFDVYSQHRVTASRRSTWGTLVIRKIEKLRSR